jgi:hypothetical protein
MDEATQIVKVARTGRVLDDTDFQEKERLVCPVVHDVVRGDNHCVAAELPDPVAGEGHPGAQCGDEAVLLKGAPLWVTSTSK